MEGPAVEVSTVSDTLPAAVGGVAVDAAGNVFVADFGDRVWKVTPWGDVSLFARGLYGASGNAVDPMGRLLQSSFHGDYLARISRTGEIEVIATGLEGPVGVAAGTADTLYVCNCKGNNVARVGPDGSVEVFALSDLFNCPNGIARADDGTLFVVNFADDRLLRIARDGAVSELARIPGGGNGHVALSGGMLYVTGFRSNRIYAVSTEGEVRVLAGTGRFEYVDGRGTEASFSSPNGIAASPNGRILYVNDYLVPFGQRGRVAPRSLVRRIELPSLSDVVLDALDGPGGTETAEAAYARYRALHPGFTGIEMNRLGYRLLEEGRPEEAVAVMEWNARDHADQWWTWDGLGDAYRAAGRPDDARASYERSLEMNPDNENARKALGEL